MKKTMVGEVPWAKVLGMVEDLICKLRHGKILPEQLAAFLRGENPSVIVKCQETGCGGVLDFSNPISVLFIHDQEDVVYPCNHCGRLHLKVGSPIYSAVGFKKFLENGKIFTLYPSGTKEYD